MVASAQHQSRNGEHAGKQQRRLPRYTGVAKTGGKAGQWRQLWSGRTGLVAPGFSHSPIFNHPNDEAVAQVLVHGGDQLTLWFNYRTQRNRRWDDADLQKRFRFSAIYPVVDAAGVTLTLPHEGA